MELLERYLQAVGRYLPEGVRGDTMAELRANLLEQMDGRAEELGRPLTEAEAGEVLREHGKPEVVALRYLPQRSLIGPTVFPFYKFAVIKALPLVVFVYAIAEFATMMSTQGLQGAPHMLWRFAWNLVPTLLIYVAWMTIAFAAIEEAIRRYGVPQRWMRWDPAKLPQVRKEEVGPKSKSVARRVFELCVHCGWMAYVLSIPWHMYWRVGAGTIGIDLDSFGVAPGPVWHTFYELLVVLLTVQLVMKLLAFSDAAHGWMKPMELATNLLGVVAVGTLTRSGEYFVAASAAADPRKLAAVNHALSVGFRIALCFAVLGVAVEGWKYVKRWAPGERMAF